MRKVLLGVLTLVLLGGIVWFTERDSTSFTDGTVPGRSRPGDVYDPVREGESLPSGFRQLLPRDAIAPVYTPEFVAAASAGWSDETLVVGVAFDDDARAYPVSFLNRREMVIERVAGIPILVTW